MKRISIIIALALTALCQSLLASDSFVTVEIEVPTMKCAGCAWSVTENLKKLESVSAVFVDPKSKKALIEVSSPSTPGKNAILAAVKKSGYEGKKYHVLDSSFAAAKSSLE